MMRYGFQGCYFPGFYGSYWGIGHMIFGGILLIVLAVVLVKFFKHDRHRASEHSLDALKRRFVLGEIDEETYQRMKRVLDTDK